MSPELISKWETLIEGINLNRVPVRFLKKIVIKLNGEGGRSQQTINIEKLFEQGLDVSAVEDAIENRLHQLGHQVVNVDFVLNLEAIAAAVQPETDELLRNL